MNRTKFIGGNWKLNPASLEEARLLASNITLPSAGKVEVVLFPPLVFLEELAARFPQFAWGAQDAFFEDTGAYTGEISLPMLKSIGVTYVLVGHSDRRLKFGETDAIVNKKVRAALADGFNVVLAVGETERGESANQVVASLRASTAGIDSLDYNRLSVAYEPVWAISTSAGAEADTPQHASAAIGKLRSVLDVRYLYGGSVNRENCVQFLSAEHIDGALIGGASLKPGEFSDIIRVAAEA